METRSVTTGLLTAGLLAALLLATGCAPSTPEDAGPAGTTGPGSPSDPAGPGPGADASAGPGADAGADLAADLAADLSAEVVQYRRDAQRGVVQVKVTNGGDRTLQVSRVTVDSPTFVTPAAADKDSALGAGLSVDLTVPLGEPACGGQVGAAGEHTALVEVDGTTVTLPVAGRVLEQVRDQRCAEADVAGVVDLAWQPTWQDADEVDGEPGLRGRLVATPTAGDVPVDLAVGDATTLFTVDEPVAATVTGDAVVLEVTVTVTRCDAHAVAEDKKGYLFPVRVRVDGAEEVLLEVAVPVPERAALQDLIDRTCA
ncbi:hypothetical protein [Jannaschia sp. R86511]|uniref:hypothetical protein n=1 Tax=Jannaschia sp. R86511 TaxID=3093853 RepID=UPI0036D2F9F0